MKAILLTLFVALLMVGCETTSSSTWTRNPNDPSIAISRQFEEDKNKRDRLRELKNIEASSDITEEQKKELEELKSSHEVPEIPTWDIAYWEAEEKKVKEAYYKKHIKPLDDALKAGEITEAQYALMHRQALTQQELEMRLDAEKKAREQERVHSAQALESARKEWIVKQRQERLQESLNRAAKRFGEQLGESLVD